MTTLVTSEDYSDAKLMGYDGPTIEGHTKLEAYSTGFFGIRCNYEFVELSPHEAEYIAKAILARVEHQKKGEG